ncbi:MAG: glycosyltransferase family 2 protein [Candidatus Margulisiibacteriota bacterium]|nr:MAG: hypothetical protein A2X43_04895 [Candidatus Margulisbacteria bacterium GWD2_39_127]OGI03621.1 MAG: hypothetical protein A2X42_01160 [Candidatus Margulisbacteria bacterium GWF2_38_17]OGI11125.1 MAG: hypothetical protein A2X41_02455 [Candidatus Margulisbacteria bacterium GWE2_39_32]PZM78229.1 MAG: glycosyltransferase family 2 protein [Candidatus Margulisiibacteriota bacterium]HAR64366.1 glycosyltransferase family 2 protein [Candidatus Margulisiibacteriota bacterium]
MSAFFNKEENRLVVLPVFNEEETILSVLQEIRRYYHGDILVIDDGSTDRSRELVRMCPIADLFVISHTTNRGYGQSLIDGFQFATEKGYDSLVTIDCDWQHEPKLIPDFFEQLDGYDIVSGSRYLAEYDTNDAPPEDRYIINKTVTELLFRIGSYALTDAFCGFKAYNVDSLRRLILTETGYGFPLQFWIQAYNSGLTVKEIPVARIYIHLNRSFGELLDDAGSRLQYYKQVIHEEVAKWK